MNSRAALVAGLFASVMATAACGDSPNATPVTPVGPSSLSNLLLPRLGGLWGGELTLSGVTGGTGPGVNVGATWCEGAAFAQKLGEKNEYTLSIAQDGSDLTARMVSASNGLSCEYTGKVGEQTLVLQANRCTEEALNLLCSDNQSRTMTLVGSSVTARFDDPINPRVISGTAANTYNVDPRPNGQSASLVVTQSFQSLTRR